MTERLYYDDAYLTHFTASVVEQFIYKDRWAVVLDRTAFYPTSGGQPFDRGVLDSVKIVDVLVRETDGAVLHLLEAPLVQDPSPPLSGLEPSDQPVSRASQLINQLVEVIGEIDWERRFDHMQQHTGQHILSQAFLQVAQAETVSFHLGAESATIDLADPPQRVGRKQQQLSPAVLDRAESLANKVVWEDRPVTTQVVSPPALADLPLRKPPAVAGDVRVVQVDGFDWSACGGTHVARTGEIGLIKIIKGERRGVETRVEFRCGRRALDDYGHKNSMVNRLAAGFNVGHWELDQAVERLAAEAKELRSCLREARRALARYEAAELRAAAPGVAGVRLVVRNLAECSLEDMRELARQLVSEPGVVALLGVGGQKAQFCFARSSDVEIDIVPLVRGAVEKLGGGRGGGRPDFAQGGGPLGDTRQIDVALDWAFQKLQCQLEGTKEEL